MAYIVANGFGAKVNKYRGVNWSVSPRHKNPFGPQIRLQSGSRRKENKLFNVTDAFTDPLKRGADNFTDTTISTRLFILDDK